MQSIKNILSNDIVKIILAFLFTFMLLILFSKLDNTYTKEGKLYITEIMPKNTYTIADDYGEYSDYIELYNGYSYQINLKNYHLMVIAVILIYQVIIYQIQSLKQINGHFQI